MANNKSTYLEVQVINLVLRGQTFTPPGGLFIGLYTAMTDKTTGGTEVPFGGTGYGRVSTTFGTASYQGDGSVFVANTIQVLFPEALVSWGTLVGFGVYDAPTNGNLLYFGTLTSPLTVHPGDQPVFSGGTLLISES